MYRLSTSSRLLSDRKSQLSAINAVNPEDFLLKRTSSNGQIEEQPIQNFYPGNNGEIQKPNSNYLKNLVKQSVSTSTYEIKTGAAEAILNWGMHFIK